MGKVRIQIHPEGDAPVVYVSEGVTLYVERSKAVRLGLFHHHIDARWVRVRMAHDLNGYW